MTSPAASPSMRSQLQSRVSGMAARGQVIASFLAVVAAYWTYWLIAVPMIEPSVEEKAASRATEEEIVEAREAPSARKQALARYFPPGSWELDNPAVWESDASLLLFKAPTPMPDGKMQLKHCTLLFFAKGTQAGQSQLPPIIMRAPEGAILEFDAPIVAKSSNLSQRQLVGGHLKGLITISREPSRPGASDDLLATTRDVVLKKNRAHTPHPVKFRMGRSSGSGRDMEIFLADEGGPGGAFRTGSLRTLQINYEVVMHLQIAEGPLVPGAPATKTQTGDDAPVKITCQGPFQYDFVRYAASFRERVDVVRLGTGPGDALNCELLTVFFEHGGAKGDSPPVPASPAVGPKASAGPSVRVLEARGDPVTLRSPARGIYIHCSGLDYWPAPAGAIGRMVATGKGVMQGNLPNNPLGKYHIEWSRQFRFEPQGTQHVASLFGGAKVRFAGMGEITANDRYDAQGKIVEEGQIHAWLTAVKARPQADRVAMVRTVSAQLPADDGAPPMLNPAGGVPGTTSLSPAPSAGRDTWQIDRVVGQGAVMIDSAQLNGTMGKLEAVIDRPKVSSDPAPPVAGDQPPVPAAPPKPKTRPRQTSSQRFAVRAGEMMLRLVPDGEEFAISSVTLDKQAHLEEMTAVKSPGKPPLVVQGERLHVAGANTEQTRVTVSGQPGYLEAGGMVLRGDSIELERQTNRLWIDGPGRMTMQMAQDFNGKPVTRPQATDITWRGSMNFQSDNVVFERGVEVKSEQQFLRTEKLDAKLNRPVSFSNMNSPARDKPGEQPQLAQIRCYGPCYLESRNFDDKGKQISFDQTEAFDLSIDRLSGAIGGVGPGTVTHVGPRGGQDTIGAPSMPAQPRPVRAKPAGDDLAYLNVQFQRTITGNLHRREVTFGEPTKTVYGPIANWDAKLNADDPASVGPDGLVLDAKHLTVRQMESRDKTQRGTIELVAEGNVSAEGTQFVARSHTVTYAEAKDQLILEGDGRSLAEIFYQGKSGGRQEAKANKVVYSVKLQHVVVSGAQSIGMDVPQNSKSKTPPNKLFGK